MIEVLFFGAAADRAGTRQTGLEVRDGATLAEVWPLIVERHPDLGPMGGLDGG
jgi:molybdopterin converting factor small subunit